MFNILLKSLVWRDLRLNPGLPDHWRTLYPRGQWSGVFIVIVYNFLDYVQCIFNIKRRIKLSLQLMSSPFAMKENKIKIIYIYISKLVLFCFHMYIYFSFFKVYLQSQWQFKSSFNTIFLGYTYVYICWLLTLKKKRCSAPHPKIDERHSIHHWKFILFIQFKIRNFYFSVCWGNQKHISLC